MTDLALTGRHLIGGEWTPGGEPFLSSPASGAPTSVHSGGAAEIDRAAHAAEEAFASYGWTGRDVRAAFLEEIATRIEADAALIDVASAETGLPQARLVGERARTCGQLRLFAAHLREGDYLDRRHDPALPDRQPQPRPDLRMIQRPLGPVGVFGASNFPLAFSTAGGDTAAALAAGCPVIVKGHPGHPGTGEIVARAIATAITAQGLPPGVFGMVQSNSVAAGQALVQHPLVQAIGFTGSLAGGRALFDLAMARPTPIPFFGELGSINPVFVLPAALAARGAQIAAGWTGALTLGVGQFCTNPGALILPAGAAATAFLTTATTALAQIAPQTMLGTGIAAAYAGGLARLCAHPGVTRHLDGGATGRLGSPALFSVTADTWLGSPDLAHEVFGPAGIVILSADAAQTRAIARGLVGQLTCTLQIEPEDTAAAQALMPILERKAGRLLVNGFPTGVEVAGAMVHGGPYPASTNFGATSVGTLAIRRFLRPVCYQNLPDALLPDDLRA